MNSHFATRIFHLRRNLPFRNLPLIISPFSTFSAEDPILGGTFFLTFQECAKKKALEPGRQAHARMIVSGSKPRIIDGSCLLQLYLKCSRLECAAKVFDRMSDRNCVSWTTMMFGYLFNGEMGSARSLFDLMPEKNVIHWTAMVTGYSVNGEMGSAQSLFDLMPERNVVSWNCLISGYLRNGNCLKSIGVFVMMGRDGVAYDETTFAVVLKACAVLEDKFAGVQVHGAVVKSGFECSTMAGNATMHMYAKFKMMGELLRVFDAMPLESRDAISWTTMMVGYLVNGKMGSARSLFDLMPEKNVIHWIAMMSGYSVNGEMGLAQSLFDLMPERNVVSWNCLISRYLRNGNCLKSIGVFVMMGRDGVAYDETTFAVVLKACAVLEDKFVGVQVHGAVVKSGFECSTMAGNATMHMYAKFKMMDKSLRVFDALPLESRDAISWTAAIVACEQNKNKEIISRFFGMLRSGVKPRSSTYIRVLEACASRKALKHGREIHGRVIKCSMRSNSLVSSAMIDMYCKCGMVKESEKLHERMKKQRLVSWNAIISGYSSIKESEAAQSCFLRMLERGVKPDKFILATVLRTCSDAELVKQIHAQIIKRSLQSKVCITSTLADMYSKCGNLQDSVLMFQKAPNRDAKSWTTMVHAHARLGDGNEALHVFEKMVLEKVKPKKATFVGVLRACADIGLVDEAFHYLNIMKTEYGLDPKSKHYSCVVDALGRSGRITDALKLIEDMPLKADYVIWTTLLSNCKMHGDVKVAEIAASSLLQLDPRCSVAYVLLSQTYADAGMWDEASKMRSMMRSLGVKKKPGRSKIMAPSISCHSL